MIILLGYLASLFSTFVISAAVLSAILTTTDKAPGQPYWSHVAQLGKHVSDKHRGGSKVASATGKDKSISVVADARRLPGALGKQKSPEAISR